MYRAICNDEFEIPRYMTRDRVPTGGRDKSPEGQEIGWVIVGILKGLLEKDANKRMSLTDLKVHVLLLCGVCIDADALVENPLGSKQRA